MSDLPYYQTNRDVILNRAKDYYGNDKQILREHARDKYKDQKNIKNINVKLKGLNIAINKIVF